MKKRFFTAKKLGKIAVIMACVLMTSFVPSYASNIQDAKDERDEAEKNKNEAEDVLDQLEVERDQVFSDIAYIDSQISQKQSEITKKQGEADILNEEIDDTKIKLADAQVAESDQYAAMKKRIQYLYENGDVEYIDTLLSAASFTDMLNKSEYVEQISSFDQEQLDSLITTRQDIQNYEALLESDLREVEGIKAELEVQKASLQDDMDDKQVLLAKYDDDIDAQEAMVARYEQEMKEADEKIKQYQEEAIRRQRDNGEKIYDSSDYEGTFMWPAVEGYSISSYFGPREAPTGGASTYHKGIDIPCPAGSDIVAGESGTVIISQYSNSAGYYIMIDHGGGVSTVYMHNSELVVGVGQTVTKGQVIAKAGSTGYSTGPHCHFGVMINGTYVNPLDYL